MAASIFQVENFELGTIGNPVTTTETIFSAISGAGINYVAGLQGNIGAEISNSGGTCFMRNSGFSATVQVFRWDLKLISLPSANTVHMQAWQGDLVTGLELGEVRVNSDGKVAIRDFQTVVATSTASLSLNTLYVLEWKINLNTDVQTLRVYNTTAVNSVTPIIEITGAITTTVPASNGTATNVEMIQLGKMFASTGFIHRVDGYKRASDWVATSSAAVTALFDIPLAGTAGNNVLVGDDADINSISATPPVYVADGADIGQTCVSIAGASGTLERFVSTFLAASPVASYERFYFKIQTAPATGQIFQIWRAENNARSAWCAAMKIRPDTGNPGTYVIGISDGTDTEVQQLSGLPLNSWMRLEIDLLDVGDGTAAGTFRVFKGNNRHGTVANQAVSDVFPNTNFRRRTIQRGVRNTGSVDPAFRFDRWVCMPDAQVGAIDDPFIAELTQQWRFSEWNGTDDNLILTPQGTVGGGTPDPNVDVFRVRQGKFQNQGIDFVPIGFTMMAVTLPIGSEGIGGPGVDAWSNWQNNSTSMMNKMTSDWKVNTMRLQLGQAGIDPQGSKYSQGYVDRVVDVVSTLRDNGFITILCMQDGASADGDLTQLPTARTQRAWQKLLPYINAWSATKRSGVAAEIFNEPRIVDARQDTIIPNANDWLQWHDGGVPAGTWTQAQNAGVLPVGHQQVLNTIRAIPFTGVVIAMGHDNGHTLSGLPVLTDSLSPANVGYSIHTQNYHTNANTASQDRTSQWEPRWGTPKTDLGIAVTSTEWSLRREVADGDTNNLVGVTPNFLTWLKDQQIGIQPWAIDTQTGDYSYVLAHSGINAWVPNDWDAWDPITLPADTGAGELLFNRYPTWSYPISPIDIGNTKVVGDGTTSGGARFPGDPGKGKILLGWNTVNTSFGEHYRENARMRTASADATKYPANSSIAEGVYRIFQNFGSEIWGNDSDTTWGEARNAASNMDVVFINYEIETGTSMQSLLSASGSTIANSWGSGTADKLTTYLNTTNYDTWIATLANKLKDIYNRYGSYAWLEITNEPDTFGRSKFAHVPQRVDMYRQATRKFYFELKAAGVENFTVTTATTILETAKFHASRHGKATANLAGNAGEASRWDALYYYNPDWKGTVTNWANAYAPNQADFYSSTDKDSWGYGTGPILQLGACNSYAASVTGAQGVYQFTLNQLNTGVLPQLSNYQGNQQKFYTALYGRKFPFVVGEYSYPIWMNGNVSMPLETADYYTGPLMDGMIDQGWVGVCNWIQNTDSNAQLASPANWLPIGGRYATSGDFQNDDPRFFPGENDAKRKGMAAMWSRPEVVLPGKWPNGTKKPWTDHTHWN